MPRLRLYPRVRYVRDAGLARESQYLARHSPTPLICFSSVAPPWPPLCRRAFSLVRAALREKERRSNKPAEVPRHWDAATRTMRRFRPVSGATPGGAIERRRLASQGNSGRKARYLIATSDTFSRSFTIRSFGALAQSVERGSEEPQDTVQSREVPSERKRRRSLRRPSWLPTHLATWCSLVNILPCHGRDRRCESGRGRRAMEQFGSSQGS